MTCSQTGRILGLDFGDKTTGVAVSDPMGWTARGVEVIRRPNPSDTASTVARVIELAREYGAGSAVLGDPKALDGGAGVRAAQNGRFRRALEKAGLNVILYDERFTTSAVEKILIGADLSRAKRKEIIDRQAAAYILQSYLDSKGREYKEIIE